MCTSIIDVFIANAKLNEQKERFHPNLNLQPVCYLYSNQSFSNKVCQSIDNANTVLSSVYAKYFRWSTLSLSSCRSHHLLWIQFLLILHFICLFHWVGKGLHQKRYVGNVGIKEQWIKVKSFCIPFKFRMESFRTYYH